ncbi:hypothetical protein A2130_02515 [Candidatus Woesebacteria bacterium GWC2_33_12]|uniref:SH3b domain-containing protein n=1 Tax=Candidatus Woesebacteria bacterium GW2011_GWB1_33_22 TaxID=1618566 RepID=A0A0G0CLD5_9BACT|nr:MAG: hypothetical protein UR29_C0013G0001 [Candidatus Woesebacteria bacterium GW2011_GWC2_33_12]KKP41686.1 MAG: hypothetical protein UR33_C0011G0001 [Candidatus Woesebacteria bacterium GW2011_GWA2_33_20]KKP44177.1 MAG: hypothetical protein UR35_C0011G0063 [Candidatus Woesebacteria bacterium GW2011_GWB1_33_22]KKP45836.1 MAG: hypothetical protein UR37_C0014G0063 [Microgenomates group bacterium GW2011_GWC1_33_28]KKP50258.1 MAG: hypothetical protein UR41_C0010G0062 [Candidatus Woesebacteria bact
MKKKIIATGLTILGIIMMGFSILLFVGFFKPEDAGILIESDPASIVYIDNKEVGATPYEANLKPGEISVRIKPVSNTGIILDDYETQINLISGIRTIIKRNFRENDDFSSGAIVSFEKTSSYESFVTTVSIPDNAEVSIDGKVYGFTPIRISVPAGDHTLLVSATGYLDKQLPIRVYKGHKLTAAIKLAKSNEPVPETTSDASESNEIKFRVRINKTDVGFLRVRSGSSIGFPEVGQVKPGEEYDVIDTGENNKWYKIQFGENEGWVSSEFVSQIPLTDTPE